ncbi:MULTISPECIES: hypothetical protein [unclassified Pseudomonas]|uniref:hypothetical protein n=1 Tax=unclassified Pseudomonas TaxID=196821 RepID=UPI0009244E2B|nr:MULTISPECIES: hypothetical protein [unclassified Pseudomonas]MDB6443842.1 hypothetical protein [Pseudomonas sp. 21TX0197]SFX30276.1 hypothetical protein SAMN03159390_00985 [Pseudomonas sp. NFACC49-2]
MTTDLSGRRIRPSARRTLRAPILASARAGVIDPAWRRAVVTIKPYPMMTCGDEVLLLWHGLDCDGEPYRHEVRRCVTERQVDRDITFVVRAPHIAELDSGSLEISYRVIGRRLPAPMDSEPLQLMIGDAPLQLLPPIAVDAVGGSLDPGRVPEGTCVVIRPYPRMAVGDRLILMGRRGGTALWRDVLDIEAHAVGREVSFWLDASQFAPHAGHHLDLAYVVRRGHSVRRAEVLSLHIGALVRQPLRAPRILGLKEGDVDVDTLDDGVTVVIEAVDFEVGEWIWLQCDGNYSHVEEREVVAAMVGQPVAFHVPAAYWQGQLGRSVRIRYQVERLDDVSQHFPGVLVDVRSSGALQEEGALEHSAG